MLVCKKIAEIREFVKQQKYKGHKVGFVPTMGYLHEGHLVLMRRAREQCQTVVISIFVNPLQFGPQEDFAQYPRNFERDAALAKKEGIDAIFAPDDKEMYFPGFCTYVKVERLTAKLCGVSRSGHFRGVATVVTKLFNIVQPDYAYFGQKDAQQVLVIRRMAADLNMNLEVITVPTIREPDGLAMSSRNSYLSSEERQAATVLYRSLEAARQAAAHGERDVERLHRLVSDIIRREKLVNLEYIEIYSMPKLEPLKTIQGQVLLALAAKIGKIRLIDNIVLEV